MEQQSQLDLSYLKDNSTEILSNIKIIYDISNEKINTKKVDNLLLLHRKVLQSSMQGISKDDLSIENRNIISSIKKEIDQVKNLIKERQEINRKERLNSVRIKKARNTYYNK